MPLILSLAFSLIANALDLYHQVFPYLGLRPQDAFHQPEVGLHMLGKSGDAVATGALGEGSRVPQIGNNCIP